MKHLLIYRQKIEPSLTSDIFLVIVHPILNSTISTTYYTQNIFLLIFSPLVFFYSILTPTDQIYSKQPP